MTGMTLTAVVFWLTIPMAISSAMIPAMVVAGTSPGMAIISNPTEHTQVMASSFSSVRAPSSAASAMELSSVTGMNAPLSPPTYEEAITPPFLTWSLRIASAAVVPGAPAYSIPISWMMSAMLSPTAGVGARDRSTMPNGALSLLEASLANSCPTRVTLNAVFLIVSHRTSKLCPRTLVSASLTTPGPLTPTLMTQSASVTPWNAPAMNGLSSGGLQNTTSLAHPMESLSLVASAAFTTMSPMSLTASMLMPVLVDPRLIDEHTHSVHASASGMDSMSILSAGVMPFWTSAEYPPMKLTPISFPTASRVFAIFTKSWGDLHAAPPTRAMGVTETLLLITGTPYSTPSWSPTSTSLPASLTILSWIFPQRASRSGSMQSSRLMPMVIVLTSRFSWETIS